MNDEEELAPFPLSIENDAFVHVDEDQSKQRKKKSKPLVQVYSRARTLSDEIVLIAPPSMDEEDEVNPLLGQGHAPAYHHYGQQQYQYQQQQHPPGPYPGQYYDYSGRGQMQKPPPPPPPPPHGYPAQYYNCNTGQMFRGQPQLPSSLSSSLGGTDYVENGQDTNEIEIMTGTWSPLFRQDNRPSYGALSSAIPPRSFTPKVHSQRLSLSDAALEKTHISGTLRRVSSEKPTERHNKTHSDHLKDPQHRRDSSDKLVSDPRDRTIDARHRRTISSTDRPPQHRRASSTDGLPPMDPRRLDHPRSFSARGKPTYHRHFHHRRGSSLSDVSIDASFGTSVSHVSIVSDISKSDRFGGMTESGKIQLRFPFENVQLRVDDTLPPGYFYQQYLEGEEFEDYHCNDEMNHGTWEIDQDLACNCLCHKCSGCTERQRPLPPPSYVLNVEDDLYRRVLDEISASKRMPCGLFFCRHHEDVRHPSVLIALGIVVLVLGAMSVAAILSP